MAISTGSVLTMTGIQLLRALITRSISAGQSAEPARKVLWIRRSRHSKNCAGPGRVAFSHWPWQAGHKKEIDENSWGRVDFWEPDATFIVKCTIFGAMGSPFSAGTHQYGH